MRSATAFPAGLTEREYMKAGRVVSVVGAALAAALLLAACRAEEQGRVLRYQKGAYLGKADSALGQDQVDRLRLHMSGQGGHAVFSGGA